MRDDRATLLQLADRCVKCAQCLPHCPTWRLDHDETESPRGRIALMQALAQGSGDEAGLRGPIDRCLGCRRCESVCPAEVPYGELLTRSRAMFGVRAPWRALWLRWIVARAGVFRRIAAVLGRSSARLFRHPALPRALSAPPAPGVYGSGHAVHGDVYLFIGCVAAVADGETLVAARDTLVDAGYRVVVPRGQGCCGALHRHAGDSVTAERMARANRDAFSDAGPIAVCASGCAAELAGDGGLGDRVTDISTLLRGHVAPAQAAAGTVLHTPCTLDAVLDEADAAAHLLHGVRRLESRGRCCGGAGEFLLREPLIAARLRDELLDDIGDATVVCTSNPGCAMHLREGLKLRNAATVVRHPVVEWRHRVQPR